MAATRPRYCGVLLVAALWLTAAFVCPRHVAAQKAKRTPPPPPFAALFPLEEAWTLTLPAVPVAPAVHDGARLYVPLASKTLVALDWKTGDTIWSVPLEATSSPLAANDLIYIAAADTVHALDAATGAQRWTAMATARVVRLAGTRVLAISARTIQAFDAVVGAPQWAKSLGDAGDPVGAIPSGDALFVSFAKGTVIRVALGDGAIVWTHTMEGRPGPPLVVKDTVYVGTTAKRFHALDVRNGKERWSWRTGGDVVGAAADVTVERKADGRIESRTDPKAVFYTSLDAVVRAVNPGNGHQRWKRDGGTRAVAPPIALDGSVLVAGLTPSLSGFAPLTGAPQGTFDLPGEVHGMPLVSERLVPRAVAVAVVLKDGRAYGLRALSLMFNESAPQPLLALPGAPLARERLPEPAPVTPSAGGR